MLHNRLQIRAQVFNPCPNFPACVHVNKDVNPVPDIIYPVFAGQAQNARRGVEGVGGFSSIASTSPGCMITICSTSTSTTRTISTKSSLLSALGGLTGELFSILRLGKKFPRRNPRIIFQEVSSGDAIPHFTTKKGRRHPVSLETWKHYLFLRFSFAFLCHKNSVVEP